MNAPVSKQIIREEGRNGTNLQAGEAEELQTAEHLQGLALPSAYLRTPTKKNKRRPS